MSGIQKYFTYHLWATKRLVACLSSIDEKLLWAEVKSSFPGIQPTLVHMAWAENIWLNRMCELELRTHSEWKELSSQMVMDEYLQLCHKTVHHLNNADLQKTVHYTNTSGEEFYQSVEEVGIHIINHASYHRGQIVTMLRNHNLENIPAFDYIAYCRT